MTPHPRYTFEHFSSEKLETNQAYSMLMQDDVNSPTSNQEELINLGANITGSVGGGMVGALLAGPLGAVIGGVAGPILTDVTQRALGRREKTRISALYRFIAAKVQVNLDSGRTPRNDGFLRTSTTKHRSDAEEIMEGVVLAAQREHEERKLKYFANLFANIAFEPSISKADANMLIQMATELTYRQLCLMAIFDGNPLKDRLRDQDYTAVAALGIRRPVLSMLQEIYSLDQKAILNSGSAILGITNISPRAMNIEGSGQTLAKLMELRSIPDEDLQETATEILASAHPNEIAATPE